MDHHEAAAPVKRQDAIKWFRNPDWWMVILTALIFVVGIITAVFFYGQLHEMSKQTSILSQQARQAARDSSEAAKKIDEQLRVAQQEARATQESAETLQRQWIDDRRPLVLAAYILPSMAKGKKMMADVYFGNYGKSPALRCYGGGTIFIGGNALKEADKWFKTQATELALSKGPRAIIPPGVPVRNENGSITTAGVFATAFSKQILSQSDIDYISHHDYAFVIVMREEYFDSLGKKYRTDGCWSGLVTGPIQECPGHNEVH